MDHSWHDARGSRGPRRGREQPMLAVTCLRASALASAAGCSPLSLRLRSLSPASVAPSMNGDSPRSGAAGLARQPVG